MMKNYILNITGSNADSGQKAILHAYREWVNERALEGEVEPLLGVTKENLIKDVTSLYVGQKVLDLVGDEYLADHVSYICEDGMERSNQFSQIENFFSFLSAELLRGK